MIKTSLNQKGSAHVVIIVILVIALLGTLGFVFWQNFIAKDSKTEQPTQTSTQRDAPKEVTYKTYQTDTHPISFEYPDIWKLENAQSNAQYTFSRSVDVMTDNGDKVSFSVGGQGVGGICGGVAPTRSTIDVVSTTLKTPKTTTLSFTVTPKSDGSYDAIYGLTDTYTEIGDAKVCDNTFYYLFDSGNDTYNLMSFSGTKRFANLDDAKEFVSGNEYSAIKRMVLTLSF